MQRTIENRAVLQPPQAQSDSPEAVSNATASGHFGHDFSRIPVFSTDRTSRPQPSSPLATEPLPAAMQAKLVVGQANDPLEHEADRVAEQVMRMPAPSPTASGVALQRKCTACEEEELGETLRAKQHDGRESSGTEAPAIVPEVLRSPGEPLDAQARAFFEPRFGRDFSQVRIHADGRDAKSAQSIGARAYTVGRHIAFAAGQYAPGSDRGRHLLAHELVHTIQQGHSQIQRRRSAIGQGVAGLVNKPEEFESEEAASPIEVEGLSQKTIQRSATWKGAAVHETVNLADMSFAGSAPITWHLLNGTKLETPTDADAAIKVPGVTTSPLPSTDPATWMAKVDTVPAQEGSGDETVLRPGPWTKVVTKAQAGGATGLAACAGAGNSTFTAHGNPSDDSVYKANRRHENRHLSDHKDAFDDAIGKWDKKLQDAKTAGTAFTGASAADATAALWTAMGNTPEKAARSYRSQGFSKGGAFHATADGGPMAFSNPKSNADCSTCSLDVTNPMP
ncbi:MAG: DUF4157 domain-containing protein [Nitrosomonas sp.]|nr:DUF4157 domain-containing protein [Nitrosomonas sp.]